MALSRMLFVELLGGIGDLVFALPSIEALKQSHPAASLDVLTFAPGGELLLGDPRVSRVLFARRGNGSDGEAAVRQDVAAVLESQPYDLVVCDSRHSRLHELIESCPEPRKVTHLWKGAGRDEPIARLFLRRLREEDVIDATIGDPSARLFLSADERSAAAKLWSSLSVAPKRVIALNPHAGVVVKRWPTEYFVTLGRNLIEDGWSVAILAGDAPDVAWTIARLIPDARIVPKLALRVTTACLEGVALVVSGDSGLAHLASAVGTPVLAIYGPTWAGRYGAAEPSINLQSSFDCPERNPMNFTIQPCWYRGTCSFPGKTTCCEDVTPSNALAAARKLLQDEPPSGNEGTEGPRA